MTKTFDEKILAIEGLLMGYGRDGYDGNLNNVIDAFIFHNAALTSLVDKYGDEEQKIYLSTFKDFLEKNKEILSPLKGLVENFAQQNLSERSFDTIKSLLQESPELVEFLYPRIANLEDMAENLGLFARFAPNVDRGAKIQFGDSFAEQKEMQEMAKEDMIRDKKIQNIIDFVGKDGSRDFLSIIIDYKDDFSAVEREIEKFGDTELLGEIKFFKNNLEAKLENPPELRGKFYQSLSNLVQGKEDSEQRFKDFFLEHSNLLSFLNLSLQSLDRKGCAESVVKNVKPHTDTRLQDISALMGQQSQRSSSLKLAF